MLSFKFILATNFPKLVLGHKIIASYVREKELSDCVD